MSAEDKVLLNATKAFKVEYLKCIVVLFAKYSLHKEIIVTKQMKNRPTNFVLKEYQKIRFRLVIIANKVKVIVIW